MRFFIQWPPLVGKMDNLFGDGGTGFFQEGSVAGIVAQP